MRLAPHIVIMFSALTAVQSFSRNIVGHSRLVATAPKIFFADNTRLFSTSSNDGSVTMVDRCRQKIQDALNTSDVKVVGAYDDPNGSHITVQVVSDMFKGKRPVQRQQMVYKALWEELQGPVHAVDSMICKTPDEV